MGPPRARQGRRSPSLPACKLLEGLRLPAPRVEIWENATLPAATRRLIATAGDGRELARGECKEGRRTYEGRLEEDGYREDAPKLALLLLDCFNIHRCFPTAFWIAGIILSVAKIGRVQGLVEGGQRAQVKLLLGARAKAGREREAGGGREDPSSMLAPFHSPVP